MCSSCEVNRATGKTRLKLNASGIQMTSYRVKVIDFGGFGSNFFAFWFRQRTSIMERTSGRWV